MQICLSVLLFEEAPLGVANKGIGHQFPDDDPPLFDVRYYDLFDHQVLWLGSERGWHIVC